MNRTLSGQSSFVARRRSPMRFQEEYVKKSIEDRRDFLEFKSTSKVTIEKPSGGEELTKQKCMSNHNDDEIIIKNTIFEKEANKNINKKENESHTQDLTDIKEEDLKNFSELDKLVFKRFQAYSKKVNTENKTINSMNDRSEEMGNNDLGFVMKLIKAYITNSPEPENLNAIKAREKDTAESESKGSIRCKERKFELFNQQYKVALSFKTPVLQRIQARRTQSLTKQYIEKKGLKVIGGAPSDESYSHTSK